MTPEIINCYLCNEGVDIESTYGDTYPYMTVRMFEVYPWKKLQNVLVHHSCLYEWKHPELPDKKDRSWLRQFQQRQ